MLLRRYPAALFGTNCYIVAPGAGEECVIIDPGIGVVDAVEEALAQLRLKPVAVLITHGHVDHCFSVTPVCGSHDVPLLVHEEDRYRVADPFASLDPGLKFMLAQQFGSLDDWAEPDEVRTLSDTQSLEIAGLTIEVAHAPGHTEGSVIFRLAQSPGPEWDSSGREAPTAFTGDVLFAGSVGRTDLDGGDPEAMTRSLITQVLTMPDATHVFPGHGEATTIARERQVNPYLRAAEHPGARRSSLDG